MRPLFSGSISLLLVSLPAIAFATDIQISPAEGQTEISPYVYGTNHVGSSTVRFTGRRYGGNRLTGYNWENNYSHAGTDWENSSDVYLCSDASVCSEPGAAMTRFVDAAQAIDAYPLLTLQMAGYVSADGDGTVSESETAPSARWKQVVARKGSTFTTTPDTTDDFVYMDELVSFLVERYGAASEGGVRGFCLDNEPGLWSSTHPRIHPEPVTAAELIERTVELASAVKDVDPTVDTFGFVAYGYSGYVSLQGASDLESVIGDSEWFVQYFLAQLAAASEAEGRRLLDVLDLHYYSEAQGNAGRVQSGTTENAAARVQSTRSLWDPSYGYSETDPTLGEKSWITEWNDPIELIPRVRRYIADEYPGTRFAISEYDFGAADHISGGIAQADALGIFGKEGVYFASRWGEPGTYTEAAFRLFLDYDGQGSSFGDVSVSATSSDIVSVPVYASLDRDDPSVLHVILINRHLTEAQPAAVSIAGDSIYSSGHAWGFDGASSSLTDQGEISLSANAFSLSLPPLSAVHVTMTTDAPPAIDVSDEFGTAGGGSTTTGSITDPTGTEDGSGSSGESSTDEGCGCRLAERRDASRAPFLLALALALGLRRMRRVKSSLRDAS